VAEALQRAAPFLRGRLAHEVTLRSLPALYFVPDTSFDQASTIDRLLRDPRVARDLDRENGDGA
jgi:ribosome-binding factor A